MNTCRDSTDQDIKDALFSIPNFKSLGPDGFNGFYKIKWDKLGPLVCAAVKEFFSKGIMPSHINETKLILRPKVTQP